MSTKTISVAKDKTTERHTKQGPKESEKFYKKLCKRNGRNLSSGRPGRDDERVDLKSRNESAFIQRILHLEHLKLNDFADVMDVSRRTIERWLDGTRMAPALHELRQATMVTRSNSLIPHSQLLKNTHQSLLQYSFPSRLSQPEYYSNTPESNNANTAQLSLAKRIELYPDSYVAALHIRNAITHGFKAVHQAFISLDRVAATLTVASIEKFLEGVKGLEREYLNEEFSYRYSWRARGVRISTGYRYSLERENEVRIEIFSYGLNEKLQDVREVLESYVYPYLEKGSIRITLLDIAVDYDVPHYSILTNDRRSRKVVSYRPEHPWVKNESINVYFGSKRSQRFLRSYSKEIQPVDVILKDGRDIESRYLRAYLDELRESGEIEIDANEHPSFVALEMRHIDPETRWRWPWWTRGWSHIHRIEASLRPKSKHDRKPQGFISRMVEDVKPFESLELVHLGLVDSEIFALDLWVKARVEGVKSILDSLSENDRGAFGSEIERLHNLTRERMLHPHDLLVKHQEWLQRIIDYVFPHGEI